MKITSFLLNQNIRVLTPGSPPPSNLGRADLTRFVRNVEHRYGFLQAPRVVSDYNLQNGMTFLEGQFHEIYISKLSVHGNGLLVEASAPTDAMDAFLDELISLASAELGSGLFEENERRRSYLSQFEAELEAGLGEAFKEFIDFGKHIADALKLYSLNTRDFELSQLAFHCDLAGLEVPRPGPSFIIGRRENEPYEKEVYFASAPLNTPDHIRLLTE